MMIWISRVRLKQQDVCDVVFCLMDLFPRETKRCKKRMGGIYKTLLTCRNTAVRQESGESSCGLVMSTRKERAIQETKLRTKKTPRVVDRLEVDVARVRVRSGSECQIMSWV